MFGPAPRPSFLGLFEIELNIKLLPTRKAISTTYRKTNDFYIQHVS